MRKMKGSGNYLKNQVRKNLAKAIASLFLFFLIIGGIGLWVLFTLNLNLFEAVGLVLSLVPLGAFFIYLRKYHVYGGGWEGEKQVVKLLASRLSDDYIILNDLYLSGGGGDIDHVILSPGGVFVLETKNWSGNISCNGDEWQRAGKGVFKSSPSRQVKRNVATIRNIIDSNPTLRRLGIWVQGIVVFTNNHANLHLSNSSVLIVKLSQLPNQILTNGRSERFSRNQLEEIAKEIIKQKR
jgi:hypothetical protein